MRLVTFDYFRGLAILIIVAGHSYGPWVIDSFGERVIANLITGGSSLFVFISGFFFYYIFYERFSYKQFMSNKLKYVFIPYLILTVLGMGYYFFSRELEGANQLQGMDVWDFFALAGKDLLKYLWTGRIATAYWYVPFILLVFVLSPLFLKYVRLATRNQLIIIAFTLLAALFVQRPEDNLSPLHSLLYFLPVYLIGITFALHKDSIMLAIDGKSLPLGLLVLWLSMLQVFFFEGYGNHHKDGILGYAGLDILLIQKIVMCFFFLSVLQKYENTNWRILNLLASASFAIYFLHPWVIAAGLKLHLYDFLDFLPDMGVFLITVPLIVGLSLCIACVLKAFLKNNSRYLTGW